MSDLQFFAFVALPLVIAAIGGIAVVVFEWRHPRRREPDLFDAAVATPRPRSLPNSDGLRTPSKKGR